MKPTKPKKKKQKKNKKERKNRYLYSEKRNIRTNRAEILYNTQIEILYKGLPTHVGRIVQYFGI